MHKHDFSGEQSITHARYWQIKIYVCMIFFFFFFLGGGTWGGTENLWGARAPPPPSSYAPGQEGKFLDC